jgi:hypothetical protein
LKLLFQTWVSKKCQRDTGRVTRLPSKRIKTAGQLLTEWRQTPGELFFVLPFSLGRRAAPAPSASPPLPPAWRQRPPARSTPPCRLRRRAPCPSPRVQRPRLGTPKQAWPSTCQARCRCRRGACGRAPPPVATRGTWQGRH